VRFSQLISEQHRIREADINPLLASPGEIVALDARIVFHDWSIADRDLPRTPIRAYPSVYVGDWTMQDGTKLTIRPIRPEDEPKLARFHETLSDRSVYLRYFHHLPLSARVDHERLVRVCFGDYDREMVLVAQSPDAEIVAVGRLTREPSTADAEFAVLVSDPWHERGLGTELLRRLLQAAAKEGIRRVFGDILTENRAMIEICRQLGFSIRYSAEDRVVKAILQLDQASK